MKQDFIEKIDEVLNSEVLCQDMITVPPAANDSDIQAAQEKLKVSFSEDYARFLHHYNGIDLDLIRLFGVGHTAPHIKNICDQQQFVSDGFLAIGDDPSAFIYLQDMAGKIHCVDVKSGDAKCVADSLPALFLDLVFGEQADRFAGEEWKQDLIDAGVLSDTTEDWGV